MTGTCAEARLLRRVRRQAAALRGAVAASLLAGWAATGGAGTAVAQPLSDGPAHDRATACAPSDEPAAVRLTLADAIARGLETSHRLAELRARGAGAAAVASGRDAASKPLVALQAGYTRTSHVPEYSLPVPGAPPRVIYPDVPDNFRARIDLQWPIFTAGRLDALARAARAEADATAGDLAAARADLRLEITRTFWALVTAAEAERVLQHAVEMAEAHLQDVRNRQQAGLLPPSDVLAAEARRSRQQVLLIEARQLRESTTADLRRLVGFDPETPLELEAVLDEPVSLPGSAIPLVAQAKSSRPERQALELRLAAGIAREQAARKGRGPVIAVAGGYDYMRPNPRVFPREAAWKGFWDVGIQATFTLWDGGRVAAEVAEAVAVRQGLDERIKEFDRVIEVDVRQRLLDLESARAEVEAAGDEVRSAAEARRVIEMRFKAGVAISSEVLDAQQALLQAELDRTRALAGLRLAVARLERAVGR